MWQSYAERANVLPLNPRSNKPPANNRKQKHFELQHGASLDSSKSPYVQKRGFVVQATANVKGDGVIAAQGGSNHGWSLYVQQGKLCFATTLSGKQTVVTSDTEIDGNVTLVATLKKSGQLILSVNGDPVTEVKLDDCLTNQPLEPLEVGRDSDGVVGKYEPPYALKGNVEKLIIDIP